MEIRLWTDDASPCTLTACSPSLREECAYIAAHPSVVPDSIELYDFGDFELVKLSIRYGKCNLPEEKRLINPEPFVFIYTKGKAGLEAPSIYSERKEFPRDVPHLNPVKDNSPCSICLSRSGMQSFYDTQGITGTISQLVSWLEDTEAGVSQHDGWEPTPRGTGISSVSLNIGALQRYVSGKSQTSGIAYTQCGLLYDNQTQNVHDFIYFLSEYAIKNLSPDRKRFSLAKDLYRPYEGMEMYCIDDIPAICMWATDENMVPHHQSTLIDSLDSLRSYAKETGLDESLSFFETSILTNAKVARGTKPYLLLILAQRRPLPLIPDIPSDAKGDARAIELIPLAIRVSPGQSPKIEEVHQCSTVAETTPSLLANMSGQTDQIGKATVVGCGALGSAIAMQLGKLGTQHLTLIDNDIFMPHNVARHTLGKEAIGFRKSYLLKQTLEKQLPLAVAAKKKELQDLSSDEYKKIKTQGVLIDCTAEPSISRLAYNSGQLPKLLKTELAHEGRLGILALEGEMHNPCIQDLKACLYKSATHNVLIEQWLSSNTQHGSVATGQNCASTTMKMPNYVVSSHASSFMPKIQRTLIKQEETAGIGINMLDEEHYPLGWKWLDVPKFKVLAADSRNGAWDVRIHPDLLEELESLSSQHRPKEAGGFLYGTYDRITRSISIVHQIAPITAKHETTSLTLPAAGNTNEEKVWVEKTAGVLPLLGTWHSHVNQSCQPSPKDQRRMADAATANVSTPTPFVILITGNDGLSVNVVLPDNW